MNSYAKWPPLARDTQALVTAYEQVLNWLLRVENSIVSADRAIAELTTDPNTQLATYCSAFDAVTVPHAVGMEAMVLFGRQKLGPVPCLVADSSHVVLLVEAGTGRPLSDLADSVTVAAGPGESLALPPTTGLRWDTFPWSTQDSAPCPLPGGPSLRPCLADALRLHAGACVPSPPLAPASVGASSEISRQGAFPPLSSARTT
ncbi:hypothetical protein ACFVWY_32800 [Streptomyces sp. NPDC058195]|uniref:hypothetical protein n=1 Tax=Streptomyces sp. NPDC058195 TaxID=3346375 RepID=UPI0036EB4A32